MQELAIFSAFSSDYSRRVLGNPGETEAASGKSITRKPTNERIPIMHLNGNVAAELVSAVRRDIMIRQRERCLVVEIRANENPIGRPAGRPYSTGDR